MGVEALSTAKACLRAMGGHARRLYWSPGGDGLEPGLEWLMPKGYEGSWLPTLAGADGQTKPTK
jgi:hypothetical protein